MNNLKDTVEDELADAVIRLCDVSCHIGVDLTSLGEYIGIKDINGTCIFTGDIILNGNNSRFVVEPMSKGAFHLTGASIDNKGIKFNISAIDNKAVVIGNIYNIREYLENNQNHK